MDYKRIYDELIEHRKMLPKVKGVYYEKHHIVPKCMGGGDEEENLVYLTVEDHFMAHVLLAKVYGGKLWYAAKMMMETRTGGKIRHRRVFGIVRKQALLESLVDNEVIPWVRVKDGKIFERTRLQMREEFGASLSQLTSVLKGKFKSTCGFTLKGADCSYVAKSYETYKVRNVLTGEVLTVTRKQMKDHLGIDPTQVTRLISGSVRLTGCYCMEGTEIPEGVGPKNPSKDGKHVFLHVKTGCFLEKTQKEMREEYGLTYQQLYDLRKGYCKTARGFMLMKGRSFEESAPLSDTTERQGSTSESSQLPLPTPSQHRHIAQESHPDQEPLAA